jgi:RHS repeat-associated protein
LSYDGWGNLATLTMSRDELAQVTTEALAYNNSGSATELATTAASGKETRSYTKDGQLATQVQANGDVTSATYNPNGSVQQVWLCANAGSPSSCSSTSGTVVNWWAYSYDADGRELASEAALSGDNTILRYQYEADGRLAEYSLSGQQTTGQQTVGGGQWTGITYDHDGNRVSWEPSGPGSATTSTYNANDSLSQTTSAAGTQTDAYDADGRLQGDTCTTYQYDGFGQTASAMAVTTGRPAACGPAPASPLTSYSYDALGRMATEQDGNGYWDDHYSSMGSEVALIQKGQAGTGGIVGAAENDLSLLLGASGTPSQVVNLTSTPAVAQWYTNDGQGNVGTVTGSTGSGAASCVLKYDIYGSPVQTTSSSNPCVSAAPSATELTELGYQFSQRDATTGDYTFGSRTYDPKKAAFTTPDAYHPGTTAQDVSIGSDPLTADTYVYANANPINLRDPNGHDPCDNSPDPASCRAAGGDAQTAYADAYGPPPPSDPACTNSGCAGEQQVATAYGQAVTQDVATYINQSASACQSSAGCSGEMQAVDPTFHQALTTVQQEAGDYLAAAYAPAWTPSTSPGSGGAASSCSGVCIAQWWNSTGGKVVGALQAGGAKYGNEIQSGHLQPQSLGQTASEMALVGVQFIPGVDALVDAADFADAVAATEAADEESSLADDLASVPCGGQSFSATSQVVLASGATVAISQLRPGAQVLATNPQTGKTQSETVQAVMVNRDTDLMDVVVNTAQSQGTIDSTAHHLFWDLTTRKWTEADQLRTGDRLFTPDGQLATVARLVTLPGAEDMWDLTVANDHDFYVVTVDTAVLVHNCDLLNGTVNANGTLESGANVSRFDAVTSAPDFLGEGSTEIAPSVWRSADGLSQFRMTSIDHANFEMFSDASDKYPIINFHANYTDWP